MGKVLYKVVSVEVDKIMKDFGTLENYLTKEWGEKGWQLISIENEVIVDTGVVWHMILSKRSIF